MGFLAHLLVDAVALAEPLEDLRLVIGALAGAALVTLGAGPALKGKSVRQLRNGFIAVSSSGKIDTDL